MRFFLTLILFTYYGFGFDYRLEPRTITEGVECFFGLNSKAQEVNGARVVNTCFIESDEGYIVIDSGPTYSYAQQAYEVMQSRKPLPVKYVINTSVEELSILGNEFYKEQGATLIGPKVYESLVAKNESLSLFEKISDTIFMNTRLTPLDVYQNSDTNITLGDKTLEIKKFEEGESQHLVVYLPNQKTIFVGNYVSNNRIPLLKQHRSLSEWIITLNKIEKIPWKYLVSAHGVKKNRKALKSTQEYLNKLKNRVILSIEQHSTKEKLMDDKELTFYSEIPFYNDFHAYNIEQACKEFKAKYISDEQRILMAMSSIETEKILAEGTIASIDITERPIQMAQEAQKEKVIKEEVIKKTPVKKIVVVKKVVPKKIVIKEEPKKEEPKIVKVQKQKVVPNIRYSNFYQAKQAAIQEHKYLLIKVEANHCRPCDKLNHLLATNNNIKRMVNRHMKAVKINTDYDAVPMGLSNMGTPTIFLIKPENEQVIMRLEGTDAFEDLEDSLALFTG